MKKNKNVRRISLIFVIVVDLFLFVSIFFLMNHVQTLLQNDVEINLTEIVTQNKDVISSKLTLEFNNLDMVATQIADRYNQQEIKNETSLEQVFLDYTREKNEEQIFLGLADGKALFSDGQSLNISGRQYFRLGMDGKQNISERITSRFNGKDIFVICVPLEYRGTVIGTIQKPCTPEQMYEICSVSLFSEQGFVYIINSQGYILISSEQSEYRRESDNYFRILYMNDPQASKQLQQDVKSNKAGFIENKIDGKAYFSAYTALDVAYDWYLISSVETAAISHNAEIVTKLFYCVLLVLVLLFTFSIIFYIRLKGNQRKELERVAFFDSVTGGSSYAKFLIDFQEVLNESQGKSLALFFFDIDNFKYINSVYGFEAGDRVLRDVQKLYSEKLHADEQIARIYSDHFIVLLSDWTAERLEELHCSEIVVEGITVYLSAGLYAVTNWNDSINLMVDKATMAAQMVKGLRYKEIGRYSEEAEKNMQQAEETKRAVELALANGEIIPFFQPKVDVNTGALAGAEALARWRTSEGRLIFPGDFIPVCEQTGLIVAVDMAVFEKTLQFIRRNMEQGVPCTPISVNFSRMHLLNQNFVDGILEKLRQYEVPPGLIELELTETVLFDNYQTISEFIERLHSYGLQIAMDDFGTGFSSLHMLKDMDIDVLKIDRGFLQETAKSNRQKVIFASIAQMAEKLEIKVVVEGVETLENVSLMKENGCTIAQGYYYAKPMDETAFEKIYQEGKL